MSDNDAPPTPSAPAAPSGQPGQDQQPQTPGFVSAVVDVPVAVASTVARVVTGTNDNAVQLVFERARSHARCIRDMHGGGGAALPKSAAIAPLGKTYTPVSDLFERCHKTASNVVEHTVYVTEVVLDHEADTFDQVSDALLRANEDGASTYAALNQTVASAQESLAERREAEQSLPPSDHPGLAPGDPRRSGEG